MRSNRCGMVKRKTDLAVKNDEAVIQDAHDFFAWAQRTEETSAIRFPFRYSEDDANSVSFLTEACEDIKLSAEVVYCATSCSHKISERDTSYFKGSFQQDTTCEGRRLVNLIETSV